MLSSRSSLLRLPVVLGILGLGCAAPAGEEASETSEDAITRAECRRRPESDPACRVEGTIEKMVVAEFDPFVVGNACVTFVKVGSRRYGLVRDYFECPNAGRYEGADVKAWFSKGAITLAAREQSSVLKGFDPDAVYYDLSGTLNIDPLPTPQPADLAAFDALTDEQKVDALYEVEMEWGNLRPGYVEKSIRILDTIPAGDVQRRALDAYTEMRNGSFSQGGDKPDVYAIQRNGVTYAYAMAASGTSWGDWALYVVYDRQFEELATFSYSE